MHAKHQLLLVVLLALAVKGSTAVRPVEHKSLRSLLGTTTCDAPADYCLVLDSSGSLTDKGYKNVMLAAGSVLTATTNPGNQYYVNQFSDKVDILMPGGFDNKNVAQTAIGKATYLAQTTNMYEGLNDALSQLVKPSPNKVKLVFLVTDGEWNTGGDPTATANKIKALPGTILITIGVGPGVNPTFLQGIATSPSYYFQVADTAALVAAINGIVARVCPMVCKDQAFTLTADSGGSCSLPACTATSGSAACYNVYVSGAQGSPVTQSPAGPIVVASVPLGGEKTVTTSVTAAYSPASQSCVGSVTIECQNPGQCKYNSDCYKVLDTNMTCGTPTCVNNACVYKPKMSGSYCDDGNPCTTMDHCDGSNYGPNACKGSAKNCAFSSPPIPSLRTCYDTPYCDTTDGTCVWPYNAAAINAIVSANSYCSTWAGAFATQLVSQGTTPNPSGSTAFSACQSACSASICAQATAPSCSCMTQAFSYSYASAGTCPPCPDDLRLQGGCVTCANGYYTASDGSHPNATCWYPNPDVKNGQGGMLYPCPGKVYTEYTLTGGTSVSQCMGCVALGSAYNKNSSTCYAGNISIPVDP